RLDPVRDRPDHRRRHHEGHRLSPPGPPREDDRPRSRGDRLGHDASGRGRPGRGLRRPVGGSGRECPVFHDRPRPHHGHDPARASVPTGPESRRGGTPCGGRGRPTRGNGAAAWLGDDGLGVGPCGPVREAHKPSRVTSSIGGGTVLSEPDLSDRFKAALLELKAEPHSATGKDSTLEILRSVVEGHRANRVVVANLPAELRAVVSGALQGRSVQFLEDLPSRDVLGACAAAEVGVTWAEYAIAEDGAIVEVAHDDAARLAASLPIVHIVLLPAGRLVRDVGEAMAVVGDILRASGPGKRPTVTFISRPSRTGGSELPRRQAVQYVLDVCRANGAEFLVKSKSLTSEEVEMNQGLAAEGIRAIETDLGELLCQVAGEKPSHLVFPAIHMTSDRIARMLSE